MRLRFFSFHLDALGFAASFLCALHCMLLPVSLSVFPFLSNEILHEPLVEWFFLGGSMILALFSLVGSFRKHRRWLVLLLMAAGFVLITLGLLLNDFQLQEVFLLCSGGLMVAAGHYANWRFSHQHQ